MGRSLDRIIIRGFKSIREADVELGALGVLIGANGSGKSNLVGVFKFLNQIMEKNLQIYVASAGGADSFLYFGRKTTPEMSLELSFAGHRNGYRCTVIPTADDTFAFKEEECWFHDTKRYAQPYTVYLGQGHRETALLAHAEAGEQIANYVRQDLRSWRIYHFHDTSDSAKVKQTGDLEDNYFLRPDAANLAAFLYRLRVQHKQHYDNIVDAIRLVAPFIEDFVLEPSRLQERKIRLEWREKGSDAYFNAFSLSDGTLRFMCLATLLLQPTLPSTILLDEPELGLHPYAITVLAELLRSAATKTQVLVSTQSVTLVNQFEPKDVIVVEREREGSTFRHLDKASMETWLEEYGVGDLWEKNLLGGRP